MARVWTPCLVREHDVMIMDEFYSLCNPTESQLAMVNLVRPYLKVLSLADVATMTGDQIELWVVMGVSPCNSLLDWPVKIKPGQPSIIKHMCQRNEWSIDTFHEVDWISYGSALEVVFFKSRS